MHSIFTVLLTLMVLVLAGCHNPITNPKPLLLDTEVDYGPLEYRQGYKDGCESALGAYGNSYQKTFYSLAREPKYQNSRMYNQVWKDSWAFCYMWLFSQKSQERNNGYGTPF